MRGYQSQGTRVKILSTRYENGLYLATIKGFQGNQFEDAVLYMPHGSVSNPPPGSIGYIVKSGGTGDRPLVSLAADPALQPQLPVGAQAIYDKDGGILSIINKEFRQVGDKHTIVGPVFIEGSMEITGDITSGGSITDADGNNGA